MTIVGLADTPAHEQALLISDIHLSSDQPRTATAFFNFLERAVRYTHQLYILGDLFEYWVGDDDCINPFNRRVIEALRSLVDAGVQVALMVGNRDFLIAEQFAFTTGVELLKDPASIRYGAHSYLLSHGDVLCVDDRAYQNFRIMVRSPEWRRAFVAKSLAERYAMVEQLRAKSEVMKSQKSLQIMDVNQQAVEDLLVQTRERILIHGHTHRPGKHVFTIHGQPAERWVLPDWDLDARVARAGGLVLRKQGLSFFAWET